VVTTTLAPIGNRARISWNHSAGTLIVQNEYRIQASQPLFVNSYNLSGSGALSAGSITTSGGGAVPPITQSGGTLVAGAITLVSSDDVYSMSGGQASVQGNLTGAGTLSLSGGHLSVGGQMDVRNVTVSAGTLDVIGTLRGSGGSFVQSGGAIRAGAATFGGTMQFDAGTFSVGTLTLTVGRLIIGPGDDKVARTRALQIGIGGTIDLGEAAAVVDYSGGSPLPQIRNWVVLGYNGGAWNSGIGIGSRFANDTTHGVGYGEAADIGTPALIFGAVDADTVLLRFTRYGDADLNGIINLDDFNRLAANFGATSAVWTQGDFNYDARVNLDDFNRLAANFGLSAAGPEVTPRDWAALVAAVPEPSATLSALPAILLLRRRSRSIIAPHA
jgi:hypothetical protein